MEMPDLQYKILPLSKAKIRSAGDDDKMRLKCEVQIQNIGWLSTTDRFWTSFLARFGFSDSIFRYFSHQEVLDRICKKKPDVEIRFCMDMESETMLAVSNPKKPIINPSDMFKLLEQYKGEDLKYGGGMLMSTHKPTSGEMPLKIGPDTFYNQFMLDTPLDGYGKPSVYLSLLREICSNGAIGLSPAFRTDITLGDDPTYAISRALDSFDSDDGYSAMRQRFNSAQLAPASLAECSSLYKLFKAFKGEPKAEAKILKAYETVVGNIHDMYGVANLDGISDKKLRLLSAKCKVYDLLNLSSEVATHHTEGFNSRRLQAWIGKTLSSEFDLEGTNDKRSDFQATFVEKRKFSRSHAN